MAETQTIIPVTVAELTGKVKQYFDQGYRLVQIGATRTEALRLTIHLTKGEFVNLRRLLRLTWKFPASAAFTLPPFFMKMRFTTCLVLRLSPLQLITTARFSRFQSKRPLEKIHD
jgi:hypothetical protein